MGASSALAAPLDDAREAYDTFDYKLCKERVDDALDLPAARAERTEAYKLLGLCHAAEDETDQARAAFITMLAVDPEARLPEGLSPRFTSSFLEAKGHWLNKTPISLTTEDERDEGDLRILTLVVVDRADLVKKIAWREVGGELSPALRVAERMELKVPAETTVEIVGIDDAAGEVALLRLDPRAPAEGEGEGEPPVTGGTSDPTPVLISLAIAGVVVAGAAVTLGVFALGGSNSVTLRGSVEFGD